MEKASQRLLSGWFKSGSEHSDYSKNLPVNAINLGLVTAITPAIIAGMKTVGMILVVALMVGPAAAAYLLAKELHYMMLLGGARSTVGEEGRYSGYWAWR